ncbi:MAG TPA: ATP-binding protein, partial [Myxococcota bacterium]|nr:ATP-binding protein [Myxococcota bacterium]
LVNAEKSRLEQVFMNLTVNAVDAMPYGGSLTIATSSVQVDQSMMVGHPHAQAGRFALISVRDSGIGMPGDVLEHLWEPFFSTKEFGKGTGLGLSTVYGIVESLGGFVQVQSEMGRGSEFKVFLPLAAGSAETSDRAQSLSGVVPVTPLSVFVAHRDPAVVARESDALTRAGFNVITATSGPEALERLWQADEQGGVKLIVVDVVMTGMGGRDICDRYRMDHLEVPVVFCAEPASPVLDEEYLRYVNGRLLMSPYSVRKLMLVVRGLIGH